MTITRNPDHPDRETADAIKAWHRGEQLSEEQTGAVQWAMCASLISALGYQSTFGAEDHADRQLSG